MSNSADIPSELRPESLALVDLLRAHALRDDAATTEVAARIALAAMRPEHLWRAMGLRDRAELRQLFEDFFPELAAGNTKDMRWKKYLYKLLCGWPGFQG